MCCIVELSILVERKRNICLMMDKRNFFNIALRRYQKDEQKNQEGNTHGVLHTSSNTNMLVCVIYQGKISGFISYG